METIHKKNGKLHIYVRQDKYKGELKSHNWVGRTYINGKQKISSSGTTNLEEAIPILEKWYDELQLQKVTDVPQIDSQKEILTQNAENTDQTGQKKEKEEATINESGKEESIMTPTKGVTLSMLDKLKNVKFSVAPTDIFGNFIVLPINPFVALA